MRSPGQSINTVRLLIHIDTSWGGTFCPHRRPARTGHYLFPCFREVFEAKLVGSFGTFGPVCASHPAL